MRSSWSAHQAAAAQLEKTHARAAAMAEVPTASTAKTPPEWALLPDWAAASEAAAAAGDPKRPPPSEAGRTDRVGVPLDGGAPSPPTPATRRVAPCRPPRAGP